MTTIVPLPEVTAGMILAADISNEFGNLLLKKDTALNDRHIKILKTWGIEQVKITNGQPEEPPAPTAPVSAEKCEENRAAITAAFAWSDSSHPVVQLIMDYCLSKGIKPSGGASPT